jgi:hypothetical protein
MRHLATHQKRREGTQHSKEKESQSVNKLGVKKNQCCGAEIISSAFYSGFAEPQIRIGAPAAAPALNSFIKIP